MGEMYHYIQGSSPHRVMHEITCETWSVAKHGNNSSTEQVSYPV